MLGKLILREILLFNFGTLTIIQVIMVISVSMKPYIYHMMFSAPLLSPQYANDRMSDYSAAVIRPCAYRRLYVLAFVLLFMFWGCYFFFLNNKTIYSFINFFCFFFFIIGRLCCGIYVRKERLALNLLIIILKSVVIYSEVNLVVEE